MKKNVSELLVIHYYAVFTELNEVFLSHLFRATWYFGSFENIKVIFYCNFNLTTHEIDQATWPEYLNSSIKEKLKTFLDKNLIIKNVSNEFQLQLENIQGDIVLNWNNIELSQKIKNQCEVFNVDLANRMEGSLYIEVTKKTYFESYTFPYENHLKFLELSKRFSHLSDAVIFCTGPSVKDYQNFDYSKSIQIVCNSIIADKEMLKYIKPDILVFADPIFHFGYSSYAEKFIQDLREAVKNFPELKIIIPFKYLPLFLTNYPEFIPFVIGVPFDNEEYNYDLKSSFRLKSTPNILTFLMIPIATTLAQRVYLIGVDGKKNLDNKYFWKHNEKTQYNKELSDIKNAHPSFFTVNYDKYYENHCLELQKIIEFAPRTCKFFPLIDSHIPVLHKIYELNSGSKYFAKRTNEFKSILVSYNPMCVDTFGHFYNLDQRIFEACDESTNKEILTNKKFISENQSKFVVPLFNYKKIVEFNQYENQYYLLNKYLQNRNQEYEKVVFYSYVTTIGDFILLFKLALEYPSVTFLVNFFYYHEYVEKKHKRYIEIFKLLAQSAPSNFQYFIDSEMVHKILVTELKDLKFWPMIRVSNSKIDNLSKIEPSVGETNVLIPCTLQFSKGAEIILKVCQYINSIKNKDNLRIFIRSKIISSKSELEKLTIIKKSLEAFSFVSFIDGTLTDMELSQIFEKANLVWIPYSELTFATRTSGMLVDAVCFEKPAIAYSRTWAGGEIQKFNVGETYSSNSPFLIYKTLVRTIGKRYNFTIAKNLYINDAGFIQKVIDETRCNSISHNIFNFKLSQTLLAFCEKYVLSNNELGLILPRGVFSIKTYDKLISFKEVLGLLMYKIKKKILRNF